MSYFGGLRARFHALTRRRASDDELGEEIGFHIDRETEKNVAQGMSPAEARRVAVAHFGGVQRVREEHRDVRRLQWVEDFVGDVHFALRAMRRTPALSGAAILTLGLGIGANVAIFSAVNAVVLQPLPFPAADRLYVIGEDNPEKKWHMEVAAPANLLDWRSGVGAFQDVMGYVEGVGHATLTGGDEPRLLSASAVTGNFFTTLGVRPERGRVFRDDESWRTGTHVVVISDAAWRRRFGGAESVVGKSIVLGGRTAQIVGVMPPRFSYPAEGVDVWYPVEWDPATREGVNFRRAHWMRVVARLKPGVTRDQANAQLQSVVDRLKHDFPATNRVMGAEMVPMHDFLVGDTRLPLLVLLTSVAFLLLIACANVGNLLLVQAVGRARETALRLALGAGRARLVRQAIAESLALSALGGAFGLALGWAGTRALVKLQPDGMLRVHDFGVDQSVLLYIVAISVMSGLIFGIAPAVWMRQRDPVESLKGGGRGAAQGARTRRWAEALVVGEVALALLMTVGAGLLVRSFWQVRRVDPGFDSHGVLAVSIGLSSAYDSVTKVESFMNQLEVRARAIPGVSSAAIATDVPFTGTSYTSDYIAWGRPNGGYGTETGNRTVSPSYFATMKVPVMRGRAFTNDDRRDGPPVIMINDALAKAYFPGEDPVGQRLAFDKVPTPQTQWYTIIGVAGNEHVDALNIAPRTEVLHSSVQEPTSPVTLLLRTSTAPTTLVPGVRAVMHDLDARLAPLRVTTMDELRERSLARIRFMTTLLLGFALVGVVLSIVGVYGVLAQTSRNRTREMGIRIALGAQSTQVRWLVVSQGLRLTAVGLVAGSAVAIVATRAMASLLFNVTPTDPATLVVVALLLAATSVVAAWIPATNASRADPAVALRSD